MFSRVLYLTVLLGGALLFSPVLAAGDMTLTLDDGTDLYLYEDSTWGYGKGIHADLEKDLEISVGGGKYILVKTDYTWNYSNGKVITERVYSTIQETGTSQNKKYNAAVAQAEKTVKNRIVARVRAAVKVKGADDLVWSCIQNSGADIDKKESFGHVWNVTRTITLDKYALEFVESCLKNPPPATKQPAERPANTQAEQPKPSSYRVQ